MNKVISTLSFHADIDIIQTQKCEQVVSSIPGSFARSKFRLGRLTQ